MSVSSQLKIIHDPVHGHFELPPHVVAVMDTPHVQRLRDLKQLGGTYMVYPGASHNRFEHSLGVSHLSGVWVRQLWDNWRDAESRAHFENERHMRTCASLVELAGLVHDLGHGPFSHMFDYDFLPAVVRKRGAMCDMPPELMHHEARSVALFEHCIDTYHLDVERDHAKAVADLIKGGNADGVRKQHYPSSLAPKFLFQVVANNSTGIDTDKFDYLARDKYNLGSHHGGNAGSGFDHQRLMKYAKIIGDDICFYRKEVFNVYNLFLSRFQLHRLVYNHRAALAIDAMLTDAFVLADEELGISDAVARPADFMYLTDSVLAMIERSKGAGLAGARGIVHRLRRRQLYRLVDEHLMPAGRDDCAISEEDVVTCQDVAHTGVHLKASDIHVKMVTLNFGMKERNPIDRVCFFKNWDDKEPVHIKGNDVSYVIPTHFQERIARVYLKRQADSDQQMSELKTAVGIAFRNYLKRHNLQGVDDDHHGYGDLSPPKDTTVVRRMRGSSDGIGRRDDEWDELNRNMNMSMNGIGHGLNVDVDVNERLARRDLRDVL